MRTEVESILQHPARARAIHMNVDEQIISKTCELGTLAQRRIEDIRGWEEEKDIAARVKR